MSSFLFGEFDSWGFTIEDVEALTAILSEDGILLHIVVIFYFFLINTLMTNFFLKQMKERYMTNCV